jgi:transposase IS66-like protein
MNASGQSGRLRWGARTTCSPAPMKAAAAPLILYTLIETARLKDVDQETQLRDVISSIADHPNTKIDELLLWKWSRASSQPSPHRNQRPSHHAYAPRLGFNSSRTGAALHSDLRLPRMDLGLPGHAPSKPEGTRPRQKTSADGRSRDSMFRRP